MIRIIKISSILITIAIINIIALPAVFASDNPKGLSENAIFKGVLAEFKKNRKNKSKAGDSVISPLVKEAYDFAEYLNPTKPKIVKPPALNKTSRAGSAIPRLDKNSSKAVPKGSFSLVATCVNKSNPDMSAALIYETSSKASRWYWQGEKIDSYRNVKEISNGVIVVDDGAKTYELAMPNQTVARVQPTSTASVPDRITPADARRLPSRTTNPRVRNITQRPTATTSKSRTVTPPKQLPGTTSEITEEEREMLEELIGDLDISTDDMEALKNNMDDFEKISELLFPGTDKAKVGENEAANLENLMKAPARP